MRPRRSRAGGKHILPNGRRGSAESCDPAVTGIGPAGRTRGRRPSPPE